MTLGGRRVAVRRPRIRSADDERELPVATYEYFADRDPLTRAVMDRMLAGVSTRKFARVGEPVGDEVERARCRRARGSSRTCGAARAPTAEAGAARGVADHEIDRRADNRRPCGPTNSAGSPSSTRWRAPSATPRARRGRAVHRHLAIEVALTRTHDEQPLAR